MTNSATTQAPSRYDRRGVSSSKDDVHTAIKNLDPGLFPGAFCKILPDYLGHDIMSASIIHNDGAGTKAGLAYLVWKLTRNLAVWKDIAMDSLVMNIDDAICAGSLGPFLVSMSIDRNQKRISGEVITALIEGCEEACQFLTEQGIPCYFGGGETADVGDLVRTITVNNTITSRFRRAHVIDLSQIQIPSLIVGFSSTGQAAWESKPNSGIGSNGLTNARHDVLGPVYRQYTETYSPEVDPHIIYHGPFDLGQTLPGDPNFTIGSALLSPTRTYAPLVKMFREEFGPQSDLKYVHCSGGGQTKIGKFGKLGTWYVKDSLFPIPPLFLTLQEARQLPWNEMYSSYNMGHRFEAITKSDACAQKCIAIAKECGINAQIVGHVVPSKNPKIRMVSICSEETGEFHYEFS
jgi:phosphoribosylformylglycinamidine cyclo-ligase